MGFCTTLSNKLHHYAPSQHSERKEAVVLQLAYSQHGTGMNGVGILQPLRAAVTQSSGGTDAGTGLLWPLLGYASCWGRAVPSLTPPAMCVGRTDILGQEETERKTGFPSWNSAAMSFREIWNGFFEKTWDGKKSTDQADCTLAAACSCLDYPDHT